MRHAKSTRGTKRTERLDARQSEINVAQLPCSFPARVCEAAESRKRASHRKRTRSSARAARCPLSRATASLWRRFSAGVDPTLAPRKFSGAWRQNFTFLTSKQTPLPDTSGPSSFAPGWPLATPAVDLEKLRQCSTNSRHRVAVAGSHSDRHDELIAPMCCDRGLDARGSCHEALKPDQFLRKLTWSISSVTRVF